MVAVPTNVLVAILGRVEELEREQRSAGEMLRAAIADLSSTDHSTKADTVRALQDMDDEVHAVAMRGHWVMGTVIAPDGVTASAPVRVGDDGAESAGAGMAGTSVHVSTGTRLRLHYPTRVDAEGVVWMSTPVVNSETAEIIYADVCVARPVNDDDGGCYLEKYVGEFTY